MLLLLIFRTLFILFGGSAHIISLFDPFFLRKCLIHFLILPLTLPFSPVRFGGALVHTFFCEC
jgi:hypothetical protein